jgi:hypothetical protein
MGAVFVLGGLGLAVVGGLIYYFLSKQETEEQTKNDQMKELIETTPTEVSLALHRKSKTESARTRKKRMKLTRR